MQVARIRAAAILSVASLVALGCGDSNDDGDKSSVSGPKYAIMYEVYDDVGSTSYLNLLDSVEIDAVDPSLGREFAGGRAFLETYGGAIYVGEPSAPTVSRYTVTGASELQETGRLSFANYGHVAGEVGSWSTNFISPNKAYQLDHQTATLVIWNPTTMEILGEIQLPAELTRQGLKLDGSPGFVRGNRLFRTFYWLNEETAEYSAEQFLAVFDTDTDTLVKLEPESRCKASGNLLHEDEEGNVYFGNWIWPVSDVLLKKSAPNCVLRIKPGSESFDPDWQLKFGEHFDGREGAMFTYIGGGQAIVSVFHHEAITFDSKTDPWELASNPVWRLWTLDLNTKSTAPLEGIPDNTGAYTPVRLEDRFFLLVPGEGWATTIAYEVTGGRAERAFDIPGWSYQFRTLR